MKKIIMCLLIMALTMTATCQGPSSTDELLNLDSAEASTKEDNNEKTKKVM